MVAMKQKILSLFLDCQGLAQQQAAAGQAQADQTSAITGMFGTVAQAGLSGGFDDLFNNN